MSNEIQFSFRTGATTYAIIRNRIGQAWNTSTLGFENYLTADYSTYVISCVEQGSASAFYAGTFPTAIPAGTYSVTAKQQVTGSPAETDGTIAVGNLEWSGTAIVPLSDLATSGLIGQFLPLRVYRGQQLQNFLLPLVSAVDHVSPFTSGIVSGQVSKDGGAFGALSSGIFTEVGLGFYKVTLNSGDTQANTLALYITCNGISGGNSDPRYLSMITQRTSGYQ